MITVQLQVPSPSETLRAYGAGAIIRVQSGVASDGPWFNAMAVPIIDGVDWYTGYDANGSAALWYRSRFESANAQVQGAWGNPFQSSVTLGATPVPRFVTSEADYEAVRALLGVTDADLTNSHLLMEPFLPHVESVLMEYVPGWESADSATLGRLRIAAEYGTAATIAETMATGGFIGLARIGGQRDWPKLAATLWEHYEQAKSLLADADSTSPLSTLTFLRTTSDYAAVAALVGEPVTRDEIELLPYGPTAERRLMRDVPDWEATPAPTGAATALSAGSSVGATNVKVNAVDALVPGGWVRVGHSQWRTVATVGTAGIGGTGVTLAAPLAEAFPAGTSLTPVLGDGTERWDRLRGAAQYAVAGLIMQTRAISRGAGGGMGVVKFDPDARRMSSVWSGYADTVASFGLEEGGYSIRLMNLSGPTRRLRRESGRRVDGVGREWFTW